METPDKRWKWRIFYVNSEDPALVVEKACFAGAAKGVRYLNDAYVVGDHDWQELGLAAR